MKLTKQQEFEVFKLVLDKFLWVGAIIILFGFFYLVQGNLTLGLPPLIAGSIVLILFIFLLGKHAARR